MQLFVLGIIAGVLTAAAPVHGDGTAEGGDSTSVIDPTTLRRLAEQSLISRGLSEDHLSSELWPILVEQTMVSIESRHRLKSMESEIQEMHSQLLELKRFIVDHDQYKDDFASYQMVISETKQLTEAQIALKRKQEQIERDRKREEAKKKRDAAVAKRQQAKSVNQRLDRLGFSSIGQDVYLSKSAYVYANRNVPEQRVYYQPGPNGELQQMTSVENREEIDYGKMTISGSLLNASKITRNVGVAFVFRDSHGNQIGQETVVIENARPDVPYPFTGELVMASDRPFASHTSWVLIADTAPPAVTSSPSTPVPSSSPTP